MLVAAPQFAAAQVTTFRVALTGDQEVPPVTTSAFGSATVVVNQTTSTVNIFGTFAGLSGPTIPVGAMNAAGHLHRGRPGQNGPILLHFTSLPIGQTSGSWNETFTNVSSGILTDILSLNTYINIHTQTFPGGELRGNVVPEPSTYALMATGLGALGLIARRRRA